MKKILTTFWIISLVVFFGCTSYERVEYKGILFEYPSYMTVSYNDYDPFEGDNIDIEVSTITEFMTDCADLYVEVGRSESQNEANKGFINTLEHLRDEGVNFDVEGLESLACGWAGGNSSSEFINVDGVNGVIYTKVRGNSGLPNLDSFAKQVLFVTPQNDVHSIVFNYHFGELGDYIDSLVDENGFQGYLNEDEDYLWEQVRDYLAYGNTITDENMKMFEENDDVINNLIESIEIKN